MKCRLAAIGVMFVMSALDWWDGRAAARRIARSIIGSPAPRYSSLPEWQYRASTSAQAHPGVGGADADAGEDAAAPRSSARSRTTTTPCRRSTSRACPGFFVTGNLYRPPAPGRFPRSSRRTATGPTAGSRTPRLNSGPGRAIGLARQGFVVFTYDMVGYDDSRQLPHTFGGRREKLWGLSLAGLQLWNSIRALDFLESLPVRAARRARRDRRVGRRHADVPAGGRRRSRRGRRAGQHDLAAHAGRLPLREPAGPAPRHHQRRDRRDDRAAAAADGVGDRRLDRGDARGRVPGGARALCAARRRRIASTRSASTRSTTTTRTAARRCTRGWRAG